MDSVEVDTRARAIAAGADPESLLIGVREDQVERSSAEVRLDVRPTDDLTAIYTFGYNQGTHVEQTGAGAGQAKAWTYNFHQIRALYGELFVQYYRNQSDANDTYLLRTGEPIVDRSTLDVFQVQHAYVLGGRQRFTYGLDAQFTRPRTEGTITGANEEDDAIDEIGAYVQSETGLTPQLDLVLSLRHDSHSRLDEAEISPRAGLVYKPQETQSFRLTWNRAFSTPSTNNLYLDLLAQPRVFQPLEAFQPVLGYNPNVDVRAHGTYRSGHESGFTFRRGADGRAMYRSSFQPTIHGTLQLMGLSPGDPGILDRRRRLHRPRRSGGHERAVEHRPPGRPHRAHSGPAAPGPGPDRRHAGAAGHGRRDRPDHGPGAGGGGPGGAAVPHSGAAPRA